LTEAIDTTTSGGKLIYSIFGALAEFERNLIRERTQLGLAAARAQGRLGGRPRSMSDAKIKQAKRMRDGGMSLADIRDVVGVSRSTLYRYLR
jgi:DNA invertase Pin-like site-specific DNA recombinase